MASLYTTNPLKRERVNTHFPELEQTKQHKPHHPIISILDDDENEPTHVISPPVTILRQQISSSDSESTGFELAPPLPNDPPTVGTNLEESSPSLASSDDKEKVMRHLLEASDDELGIPTSEVVGVDEVAMYEGLWELEDEAANYYTLLQAELFM